ncbi:hypothetical protein Cgig2_026652 [Carnegiea gigantea]|uniref:dolichol kinase n=1 Tax=Carnegiea gigantea TaxID=171969 RepID=A0A9Q1GQ39_9CARY|nr:hypothetical protein Cgig2_026652 [Carnegiea gigantea]
MALMASSLLNGERAVVLLLLFRVLFSAPFSLLLFESVALSLLGFVALFVEISVESSSSPPKFSTRPGASPGILLGAITLPALMFSKLIQLSRGLPLEEVSLAAYLMFPSGGHGSNYGVLLAMILLWMLGHGVAAVKLIQHILQTFPLCASIGEALLVTAGLTTYSGDILGSTVTKIARCLITSDKANMQFSIKRSEISTIIQCYLLGLLLLPLVFKISIQIVDRFTSPSTHISPSCNDSSRSFLFFTLLMIGSTAVIPFWVELVQDFKMHPLWWVLTFVFSEPRKRLTLCVYWVGVIAVSVHRFYSISKSSKIERILLRKYYHLMAVSMFVPALILQPTFLNLAFGAALAAFLVLEIIRVWRIWPFGEMIHHFMNAFTDHRDSDLLIVSHFSLLLGCALPIWMSSGFNDRPLAPFAGILSLGIGDTMVPPLPNRGKRERK